MQVIGLTGGIASGKSTVASILEELGAKCLDADQLGHQVLLESRIKGEIQRQFGDGVFDSMGEIVRAKLAAIVFGHDPASRQALLHLEQITHPRISEMLQEELGRLRELNSVAAILDAAVMFRAGWDRVCDRILFVRASREARLRRAKLRGWTEEQFAAREANQMDLEQKERRATDFVDNSSDDRGLLRSRIEELWKKWGLPRNGGGSPKQQLTNSEWTTKN